MGREIESDGDALLTPGEVAAVEGVRILPGGGTGILPDRPPALRIHGGVGATPARGGPGGAVEGMEPRGIAGAIDRLHRDALRRLPSSRRLRRGDSRGVALLELHVGE